MSDNQETYQNPVLTGFFPDPSVCRVGDDYYLVNSSFQYWPAIPVSHSRDLVHWTIIGHAITDVDSLDLSDLADSHGIWAPDISWRDGVFSIYATLRLNNPREGETSPLRRQVLMCATRPEGPWSKPVSIEVDNIDPSLFMDDDGQKYMLISPGINLIPLADDGSTVIGPAEVIWPGTGRRCPEGPHLFKRDGWYYAMLAEGGTGYGHCITVARSRRLRGPYEECPHNPVLSQNDPEASIQRTGHGKLVQTPAGDWWIMYLCGRPNGGPFTTLGRETALDPLEWGADGWFTVNQGRGPSLSQTRPALPPAPCAEAWRDDFEASALALHWQFVRNPQPADWSLSERPGFFRIWTGDFGLDSIKAKNTLVRREKHHAYTASTRLEFQPTVAGTEAGLVCYYDCRNHIRLALLGLGGGDCVLRLIETRNAVETERGRMAWNAGQPLRLRVEVAGQCRQFRMAADGGDWRLIGTVADARFLSDEGVVEGKHHTGTMVGVYAHNGGSGARLAADFDCFEYEFGQDRYTNPVLHADYSDPDAIRVGDDYFMVSSSFNSIPGIPLLHSKNLVDWQLVNYVVKELPWPGYDMPAFGRGVWAPSIRHHDGQYFVFFGSPDEGVFMSRARDPAGDWSPLMCVKKAMGWIDPCPFWDDDGAAYLVNAFANSRVGFKSVLRLSRLSPDGKSLLGEGRFIFDGQDRHLTMEGPKLYKRNGWYYIFAPAGGVKQGWQTVLRSRNIWGPYEDRIVLHQGDSRVNGPHQGAWVDTADGESWFLHFQDKGAYGRVVHLQPLHWQADWPLIGIDDNNDGIGEALDSYARPRVNDGALPDARPAGPVSDVHAFSRGKPGLAWQWQANPRPEWLGSGAAEGQLRLNAQPLPAVARANLADAPHVLSIKFPAERFVVETTVELHSAAMGDSAGLVVLGDEYAGLAIRRDQAGAQLVRLDGGIRWGSRGQPDPEQKWSGEWVLARLPGKRATLVLRVREGAVCQLSYRLDGGKELAAGPEFSARPGLWVGAKIGLFCLSAGPSPNGAHADFRSFRLGGR